MVYIQISGRETKVVSIYDSQGEKIDEILLKEKIMPIPTKRGGYSASGLYYKGAGIVYRNHLGCINENIQNDERDEECQIIGKTGLVYENVILCKSDLVGKFGIFTFQHQPIFSDYEGGCGLKEQKLVLNQKEFELSAVDEIVDVIPTGLDNHNIYCYRLKDVKGNISNTIELLKYVLENDWNTAWDKNLWEDIESYGYVRDVADWFRSREYKHKLGTVFALLNSLYRANKSLYGRLLIHILGYYDFDKKHMLYKELVNGKACCHFENDEKWSWVREYYENEISK